MREVTLPSGALLKIALSPFAVSKALYQVILGEMRSVEMTTKTELGIIFKELFCIGFSSPAVEQCLWECFKRCTYNSGNGDLKIDEQTFESADARSDYMQVCMEVAKDNILPFAKSLYAEYQKLQAMTGDTQK